MPLAPRNGVPALARIEITTRIQAPPQRCFDLARDLDFHRQSLAHTGERIVAGRAGGLIGPGEEVTWEARHFGIRHRHTAAITQFDAPRHFRDVMTKGRFRRFEHDHWFTADGDGTVMRDVLEFASPLGWLGRLVDGLVLRSYLTRLLQRRAEALRREAEAVPAASGSVT